MSWVSVAWNWYFANSASVNPIAAFAGAAAAFVTAAIGASAALRNARSATRQAEIASLRHKEQTEADRRRRLTESFSKAIEQLGSDKLEVRLGGIYALERISNESPEDYWTVMETLTAFVRERTRQTEHERNAQRVSERAYFLWENAGKPDGHRDEFWAQAIEQEKLEDRPATDINAILAVIMRRSEENRKRESEPAHNHWRLNFNKAALKHAGLKYAQLEGASFSGAHLEHAFLFSANLKSAFLADAHLEGAILAGANLEHAYLEGAHFEGTNLAGVTGLENSQGLAEAHGDAFTRLPKLLDRPAHWPPEAPIQTPAA